MMIARILAPVFLLTAVTASAQTMGDVHDGISVDQARTVVTELGYRAQVRSVPETNIPFLQSGAHGIDFVVYFYGCEKNEGCTSVQYTSVWPEQGNEDVDINAWNSRKRFIVAFRQEDGSIGARMDANVDDGVTMAHFKDTFEIWVSFLDNFDSFRKSGNLN